MSKAFAILTCLGVLTLFLAPAVAQEEAPPPAAPAAEAPPAKEARRWRASVMVGAGSANGQGYFVVGGSLGYALALGLVLSVDGQWWTGQSPDLGKIAPGLTWYAPIPFHPYVGAYYAHWFVSSGLADQDALGGRAGISLASTGPAFVAFGLAYEHVLSCSTDCDSWWPELSAGVAF